MPCLNSLPAWPIDRASLGSLDAPNMRSRMSRTTISSPPPRLGILYLRSSAVAGGRGYLHSHEFHVLCVRNLERKSADRDHYLFHPGLGQASDPVDYLLGRPDQPPAAKLLKGYFRHHAIGSAFQHPVESFPEVGLGTTDDHVRPNGSAQALGGAAGRLAGAVGDLRPLPVAVDGAEHRKIQPVGKPGPRPGEKVALT